MWGVLQRRPSASGAKVSPPLGSAEAVVRVLRLLRRQAARDAGLVVADDHLAQRDVEQRAGLGERLDPRRGGATERAQLGAQLGAQDVHGAEPLLEQALVLLEQRLQREQVGLEQLAELDALGPGPGY